MRKFLFLLFFPYSNILSAQPECLKDTVIVQDIKISYSSTSDSTVKLNVEFKGSAIGCMPYYYDPNECSYVPKFIKKINDSTVVFLHGKGQHYRVITVASKKLGRVRFHTFENEIFETYNAEQEKLFFAINGIPYLLVIDVDDKISTQKYKSKIKLIKSDTVFADLYKEKMKISDHKGNLITIKYQDFKKE